MSFLIGEAFLGVFAAFALQRAYSWYRDNETRKKLKESLRTELKQCISRLNGEGLLLPIAMWHSTVTSGDVKLLSFNERTQLAAIYFKIENHNYEAKRVRDSEVVGQTAPGRVIVDGMSPQRARWNRLRNALREEEKILKEKIEEFLKAAWW